MNVDLGIWGKLTKVVTFLLLIAGVLLIAVWYLPLIRQNERMRKEILRQDVQIEKEEAARKQLKAAVDTLARDTNAVERLAREKLRYAKPGEIVVKFEAPETNHITR